MTEIIVNFIAGVITYMIFIAPVGALTSAFTYTLTRALTDKPKKDVHVVPPEHVILPPAKGKHHKP